MTTILHSKTGTEIVLPDELPLQVEVKEEDGEIVDVTAYTHSVNWKGRGVSGTTYCNNCGNPLFYGGMFKLIDGDVKKAKVCAGCGSYLGFFN